MSQNTDKQVNINPKNNPEGVVEHMVVNLCEKMNIKEEKFGNILLAVTEAVNNAIEHGNKNNPEKRVHLSYKSSPEKITFTVSDEGQGFDLKQVPDPTQPETKDPEAGRGIFVMKHLADKLELLDNGKKVLLSFNLN
ncbi:MAG TPA: ATP-binding protein [Bacteroidia bacterium]|jgi:serine/threonine-protein kinase RsbW|nr:ATP-binding protein [Bacteroidia bacterium]